MKNFLKRYWHALPFATLAIRAVMLATLASGLWVFAYFFIIVMPIEVKHYRNEKARIEWQNRIKNATKTQNIPLAQTWQNTPSGYGISRFRI